MQKIINALHIISPCLINKRITKTAISTHAILNASEKKYLKNFISEIIWIANYKPINSNIPVYIDENESYDEVQIIFISLKDREKITHVINLIQKIMPYPIVLFLFNNNDVVLSTSNKFINQADKTKRTINGTIMTDWIDFESNSNNSINFINSINTKVFTPIHLKSFYENFILIINQYKSAQLTGNYRVKKKLHIKNDAKIIEEIETFDREIISLKSRIQKETIFSKKVTLNILLKKVEEKRKKLIYNLS